MAACVSTVAQENLFHLPQLTSPKNNETDKVNNILIGTHITITANRESPSNQKGELNPESDWSVLLRHTLPVSIKLPKPATLG